MHVPPHGTALRTFDIQRGLNQDAQGWTLKARGLQRKDNHVFVRGPFLSFARVGQVAKIDRCNRLEPESLSHGHQGIQVVLLERNDEIDVHRRSRNSVQVDGETPDQQIADFFSSSSLNKSR